VTPLAELHEERRDDVPIAALQGEVDSSNVAEIGERMHSLLTNRSTALVVDLTRTTYLDSAGINLLFELASALEHRQQRLRVVVPPTSHVARMLGIAGLAAVAPLHATLDAALAV
jgi:anti-sigma B factor antagonist